MQKYQQKISLVVPFYNEGDKIFQTYHTLSNFLRSYFRNYELIFVNDGSTDKGFDVLSEEIKKDKNVSIINYQGNRGRGYALMQGFGKASGNVIGYIDSDLEIKESYIVNCMEKLECNCDGVVVSKHLPDSRVLAPLFRKIASYLFNKWIRFTLSSKLSDHQAGLKIFKREVIKKVLPILKSERWFFDVELLYYIQMMKFHVEEVPIKIRYGYKRSGSSQLAIFIKDYIKSYWYVLKLRKSYIS